MGQADVRLVVDAERLVGLELKISCGHWLGAKVDTAEREIVEVAVAVLARWGEVAAEFAHIKIAIAVTTAGVTRVISRMISRMISRVIAWVVTGVVAGIVPWVVAGIVAWVISRIVAWVISGIVAWVVAGVISRIVSRVVAWVISGIIAGVISRIVARVVSWIVSRTVWVPLCCLGKDLRLLDHVLKWLKRVLLSKAVSLSLSESLSDCVHSRRRRTCRSSS